MILTQLTTLFIVVHPSCLPFIRETEATVFQAQTALQTSRRELAKLESRRPTMENLAKEGAISQRQWEQFQGKISQIKAEIADLQKIETEAKNQIITLKNMPKCIPAT